MNTKLSHSQVSRYQMCGHSYKLHYIDKIRPRASHAALIFGSAIDSALNALLTGKGNANEIFEQSFTYSKVNDVETYIPTCTELVYANADQDSDLLTKGDSEFVTAQIEKGLINKYTDYLEVYKVLNNKKKSTGLDSLTDKEKVFYNLMNWLSLRQKGFLMIEAYRTKVLPRIEKVYAIQEYVELINSVGDKVIGYVDLIADVKDIGRVIIDNKTSAMEYEDDSVLSSSQLSLYIHMLEEKYNTRKAGYIVLRKGVIKNRKKTCGTCGYDGSGGRHKTCNNEIDGKRCGGDWTEEIDPEIAVQFIIDEIPVQTEQLVLENIDMINEAIKGEHFTKNLNSCSNWFGGKCPYFNKCYRGSDEGLINMNKGKK